MLAFALSKDLHHVVNPGLATKCSNASFFQCLPYGKKNRAREEHYIGFAQTLADMICVPL
jgi:hypothetical protein